MDGHPHPLSCSAPCSLGTIATAQVVTFARDDYASDVGARAIVSADFNRDGWLDVAQANVDRNSVTILLSRGGSGLERAFEIPVGAGPFDLTTGDFNRDGIPDLAVANADGHTISILLGRGDGSFRRADIAAASQNPRGITTADVNNDGRPDLIYTGYATGTVQVLIGNGAGRFAEGPSQHGGRHAAARCGDRRLQSRRLSRYRRRLREGTADPLRHEQRIVHVVARSPARRT